MAGMRHNARIGKLRVDFEFLRHLLQLPANCEIVAVERRFLGRGSFDVVIKDPNLPMVDVNEMPELEAVYEEKAEDGTVALVKLAPVQKEVKNET